MPPKPTRPAPAAAPKAAEPAAVETPAETPAETPPAVEAAPVEAAPAPVAETPAPEAATDPAPVAVAPENIEAVAQNLVGFAVGKATPSYVPSVLEVVMTEKRIQGILALRAGLTAAGVEISNVRDVVHAILEAAAEAAAK